MLRISLAGGSYAGPKAVHGGSWWARRVRASRLLVHSEARPCAGANPRAYACDIIPLPRVVPSPGPPVGVAASLPQVRLVPVALRNDPKPRSPRPTLRAPTSVGSNPASVPMPPQPHCLYTMSSISSMWNSLLPCTSVTGGGWALSMCCPGIGLLQAHYSRSI